MPIMPLTGNSQLAVLSDSLQQTSCSPPVYVPPSKVRGQMRVRVLLTMFTSGSDAHRSPVRMNATLLTLMDACPQVPTQCVGAKFTYTIRCALTTLISQLSCRCWSHAVDDAVRTAPP